MAAMMRAKMKLVSITVGQGSEKLSFQAVAASSYPEDGSDENNTYARWSPSASVDLTVMNPALHGKFKPGEEYYVDFIPAN